MGHACHWGVCSTGPPQQLQSAACLAPVHTSCMVQCLPRPEQDAICLCDLLMLETCAGGGGIRGLGRQLLNLHSSGVAHQGTGGRKLRAGRTVAGAQVAAWHRIAAGMSPLQHLGMPSCSCGAAYLVLQATQLVRQGEGPCVSAAGCCNMCGQACSRVSASRPCLLVF